MGDNMKGKLILFCLLLLILGITIVYAGPETWIYKDACRYSQPKSTCDFDSGNIWSCVNNNHLQCIGTSCPNRACKVFGILTGVSGAVSVGAPIKSTDVSAKSTSKSPFAKSNSLTGKAVSDLSSANGLDETRVYIDGCRFDAGKYKPKSNCGTNDGNKWACINNRLNLPDGLDLQCTGKLCPPYACKVMGVTTMVTGAVTGAKRKAGKFISVAKSDSQATYLETPKVVCSKANKCNGLAVGSGFSCNENAEYKATGVKFCKCESDCVPKFK